MAGKMSRMLKGHYKQRKRRVPPHVRERCACAPFHAPRPDSPAWAHAEFCPVHRKLER